MFSLINTDGMRILKTIIETCFQITLILTFFIKRDTESASKKGKEVDVAAPESSNALFWMNIRSSRLRAFTSSG